MNAVVVETGQGEVAVHALRADGHILRQTKVCSDPCLIRLGAVEVVEHLIESGNGRGLDRLLRDDVALDGAESSGAQGQPVGRAILHAELRRRLGLLVTRFVRVFEAHAEGEDRPLGPVDVGIAVELAESVLLCGSLKRSLSEVEPSKVCRSTI